jgi:toxin CcdB
MMQFDVYRNSNPASREAIPYLLDIQSDMLEPLSSRVVIPLVLASEMGKAAKYLNPTVEIEGVALVMSTAELAGVPSRLLGDKVQSLAHRRDEIIAALDFLFSGF